MRCRTGQRSTSYLIGRGGPSRDRREVGDEPQHGGPASRVGGASPLCAGVIDVRPLDGGKDAAA
jgi:hypothetical protein